MIINLPIVSIIIPVYNSAEFLQQAIESILNQSYKNLEIIFVYDESKDLSLDILNKYSKEDNRILIKYGDGKGLIEALNLGIAHSTGEFLARMDADDLSCPNRIKTQVEALNSTKADICGGNYFIVDQFGNYVDACIVPTNESSIRVALSNSVPFAHGSVVIRKKFLEDNKIKYGNSGYQYAEDYALWLEMYKKGGKFINVSEWIFSYRDVQNSLSKKNYSNVAKDTAKLSWDFVKENLLLIEADIDNLLNMNLTLLQQEQLGFVILVVAWIKKNPLYLKKLCKLRKIAIITSVSKFFRSLRILKC